MKKFILALAVALLFVFVTACGGDSKKGDKDQDNEPEEISDSDGEPAETEGDAEPSENDSDNKEKPDEEQPEKESLKCEEFAEGLNENFMVGDLARSFILRLPEGIDSDKELPVIFLYHGFGDTAENFEKFMGSYVNNEKMPFILVVPESRSDVFGFDNIPPSGLDWDMMNLKDGSAEADMFDAVLACLEKNWKIDAKHIHVSGFSAGAITANSIGLQRPDKVASILSYSGAYFSDKSSRDDLGSIMGMNIGDFFSWPDFEEEHNKYPQVFVYGDEEADSWGYSGVFTIYFNRMARFGAQYLTGLGHDAILCNHGIKDHTVAGISADAAIKFFADHPFGKNVSPYKEEMPAEFSKICHFFTEDDIVVDDPEEPETPDGEPLTCENFKEGYNKNLMVGEGSDTLARNFYLRMPPNTNNKKLPVVFFYHPYNTEASDIDTILSGTVNNETMPFILVIPEARGDKFQLSIPPTGLDWDIVTLADGNAEADMFSAIMDCLESKEMVDEEHIHISGFSAGAIAADSVALMRSDKVASVLTYSGAYFSNPANREALGTVDVSGTPIPIGSFFSWPDFEENHNKYTQMFMFGDAGSDTWSTSEGVIDFTIDFNETGENDGEYLSENGHSAILCNHGGGHNPQTSQNDLDALVKFFHDHPLGTNPSPYKDNMPQEFSNCVIK